MATTIMFMNRITNAARVETAKSHLQQKVHSLVDKITNEIRESRWRWMYIAPTNPTTSDKNSFLVYCSGRDNSGTFRFNTSGTIDGGVNWQGLCLIAAVQSTTVSNPQTYILRKYTDYRFNLASGYLPITPDPSGYTGDTEKPADHPDINVDTTSSTTQFILKRTDGTIIARFNRDGTSTGGANGLPSANQTDANFKSEILMYNITQFRINTVSNALPSAKVDRYSFPFRLEIQAYYAKENVTVKLETEALALNKNN